MIFCEILLNWKCCLECFYKVCTASFHSSISLKIRNGFEWTSENCVIVFIYFILSHIDCEYLLVTCFALTTWSFKYPTACPYQGPSERSCVEIQLISGEGSLDPHGESVHREPNGLKSNQPHNIRPDKGQTVWVWIKIDRIKVGHRTF